MILPVTNLLSRKDPVEKYFDEKADWYAAKNAQFNALTDEQKAVTQNFISGAVSAQDLHDDYGLSYTQINSLQDMKNAYYDAFYNPRQIF